jgi:large subunit ribosomal protein L7/L12
VYGGIKEIIMREDKTHIVKFDVVLVDAGENVFQMMRIIMDITGWGLKQSKDLLDQPPGVVLKAVSHTKALAVVQRLEGAGAKAEVRRTLK